MALTDNLTHGWRFEGNANDSVGSFNGTSTNITYNTSNGKITQGAGFDGSSSKITALGTYSPGSSWSICFWIYRNANSTVRTIFCPTTSVAALPIIYLNASNKIEFDIYNTSTTVISNTAIALQTWTQVLLTWNQSTGAAICYLNGSSDNTGTNAVSPTYNADYAFGKNNDANTWFPGNLDEVYTWDRILSSSEATQMYNSGNGLYYNGSAFVSPSTGGFFNLM